MGFKKFKEGFMSGYNNPSHTSVVLATYLILIIGIISICTSLHLPWLFGVGLFLLLSLFISWE